MLLTKFNSNNLIVTMPKLSWIIVIACVILQTLVDQVKNDKKAKSRFKKKAWIASFKQIKLVA